MKAGDIYLAMIEGLDRNQEEVVKEKLNNALMICNEVFPGTSYREDFIFEPKFIFQNDDYFCTISIRLLGSATDKYIANEIVHTFASLKVESAAKRLGY